MTHNPQHNSDRYHSGGLKATATFRDSPELITKLKTQNESNKLIAAICASPAEVLATHGFLEGRKATGFPGMWNKLPIVSEDRVVQDGNIITSQGPGTTFEFAGQIIATLISKEKADAVFVPMRVKF
jgi:protein deglycase